MSTALMTEPRSYSENIWQDVSRKSLANASQRLKVLRAPTNEQQYWRGLFADGWPGFLSWLNLACWTYDPRLNPSDLPFTTWAVQETAGRALWEAVDLGHDVLIDKSRDMGASWLSLAVLVWWWQFTPDCPLLMASRKEVYVDDGANPDSLFWKVRYLVDRQPGWLAPAYETRHMQVQNLENGSVINGESTNTDLGRGGRRKAILLDEFAAVDNGSEILAATVDATPCRVFNSTPQGRGNAFANMRFSGKIKVITLHWSQHPTKGKDAKLVEVDGVKKWASPWYEKECARRTSRKEIAQELDIDYLASGDAFFDLDVFQRMRVSGVLRAPDIRGELSFEVKTLDEARSYRVGQLEWHEDHGRRRLALWNPPDCQLMVDGRPRQDRHYVAFADIAHGVGASNSVIKFAEVNTRHIVAQWLCPDTSPDAFAEQAAALGVWFGGKTHIPLIGWEANGPGGMFGRRLFALGYPLVLGNPNLSIPWEPEDNKIGWTSSATSKALLLGELRAAWSRDELIEHDEATIAEAEQYIYYASGAPGPSGLVNEPEGARKAHGDRVIAAAGLILCLKEQPRVKPGTVEPPGKSYLARRRAFVKKQKHGKDW